jgi:hypothetical protein
MTDLNTISLKRTEIQKIKVPIFKLGTNTAKNLI